MGFLDKLADWLAPSAPAAPAAPIASEQTVSAVPAELPRIAARTAGEICKTCKPGDAAKQLLMPQATPSQFLSALQEKHLGSDMVKVLAYGLPDREGVAWAVQCALKVAAKLPAAEVLALQAAQAWVKNPTPEQQAAAGAAAGRTDFQGPGAWAAQAAASAKDGQCAKSGDEENPRLTPHAVGGAVLLASSILNSPEYAARLLSAMKTGIGGAAVGASAGLNVPRLPGLADHLQVPTVRVPGVPSAPDVALPQLPGAAGKVQAGIGALPGAAGMAASGANLPAIAGAVSPALGAVVQGGVSGGAAGAMAAAVGAVPVLSGATASAAGMAVSVPGAAGLAGAALPNVQMPSMTGPSMPGFSQPNMPQVQMPAPPPPDPVTVFRGQQPFIEIGLGIASGKLPVA